MIQNPLLEGFYPDPSVCRTENGYYLVTSTFAYTPGVPVFYSKDMVVWEQAGHVLEREQQLLLEGAGMSEGIYAPCIRYHQGLFYMITTNVSGGGNFYVTASRAEGPWSDPVYLKEASGIDPSLYFEGEKCFYIGQRTKKDAAYFGDCEIWLQELDLKKKELTGDIHVLWDGAMKNAYWPEGPHLYKKDDYYYLLIAEGGTQFDHSICIARSKELCGPYQSCPMNPIFTHRHLGHSAQIQCTGHGELVETDKGQWYMVLLGTRPVDGVSPLGRETFLAKVEWENDWPVINPGKGMLQITKEEKKTIPPIEWKMPLDFRCIFFRYPEKGMYRITEDKRIALKPLPFPFSGEKSPAYIGTRVTAMDFCMETTMEFSPRKSQEAGLVYLYDENNYMRCVLTRADTVSQECVMRVIAVIKGKEKTVTFRNTCAGVHRLGLALHNLRLCFLADGEPLCGELDVSGLSSEKAGGFVGCTAGIYAASDSLSQDDGKENTAIFSELTF